jgi:curved DNA-binding protein CbpA
VKKAYKELAKLHHPDRETGNVERFQTISKAWKEYQKTRAPAETMKPARWGCRSSADGSRCGSTAGVVASSAAIS